MTITNTLGASVEATIRPGSPERYVVSPSNIWLKPGESVDIEICLKLLKYAHVKKAVSQGQRDIFHIKVHKEIFLFKKQAWMFLAMLAIWYLLFATAPCGKQILNILRKTLISILYLGISNHPLGSEDENVITRLVLKLIHLNVCLQSKFFDQKYYATFFLDPEATDAQTQQPPCQKQQRKGKGGQVR